MTRTDELVDSGWRELVEQSTEDGQLDEFLELAGGVNFRAILHDLIREAQTVSCPECGGGGDDVQVIVDRDADGYSVPIGEAPVGPCPTCKGRKRISLRYAGWLEAAGETEKLEPFECPQGWYQKRIVAASGDIEEIACILLSYRGAVERSVTRHLRTGGARQEEERNADRD